LEQSLRESSLALLCDYRNSNARDHLRDIAGQAGLAESRKNNLVRILELIDYLKFLQERIAQLKIQNDQFGRVTVSSGAGIATPAGHSRETVPAYDSVCSPNAVGDVEQIFAALIHRLAKEKDLFVSNLKNLQEKNASLKAARRKDFPRQRDESSAEKRPSSLRSGDTADRPEADLSRRENEAEGMEDPARKVEYLTRDLAKKSLDLFETEGLLAQERERFSALEKDLVDIKERFALVQHIIQEKNAKVVSLESSVGELTAEAEREKDNSRQQIQALQEQLNSLRHQLAEQAGIAAAKISSLERLLADQELRLADYKTMLNERESEIDGSHALLLIKDSELNNLREAVAGGQKESAELSGIIQIYKDRLRKTSEELRAKTNDFNTLRAQILEQEEKLDASYQSAQELYQRIMSLQSQYSRLPDSHFFSE